MKHADFGPRLRQLRQAAGITLAHAARTAGVSEDSWSRWELGRTMPQLCRSDEIANAIGVPTAALTAPDTVRVIADVAVSTTTYERVRATGTNALDELIAASNTAVEHALRQHFAAATPSGQRVRRRSAGPPKHPRGTAIAKQATAARLERERQQHPTASQ